MEWKDVVGYEGYYMVSSCGQVKSVDREIKHGKSKEKVIRKGVVKSEKYNSDGYRVIRLSKHGKAKSFRVHRLVALAFLGEPKGDRNEVNHIDMDKKNNDVKNLEWVNHKENMEHAYSIIRRNGGRKIRLSKLKKENINEIKEMRSNGISVVNISKVYGIHISTVYRIIKMKVGE